MTSMHRTVNELADELNDEIAQTVKSRMTGKRLTMMTLKGESVHVGMIQVKSSGWTLWQRGDGSSYKDPGHIYIDSYNHKRLCQRYSTIKTLFPTVESVIDHVWKKLEDKPRAKVLGMLSGEFGGSGDDGLALRSGSLLWVKRNDRYVEFGSMSRLKNTDVWRLKPLDEEKQGS